MRLPVHSADKVANTNAVSYSHHLHVLARQSLDQLGGAAVLRGGVAQATWRGGGGGGGGGGEREGEEGEREGRRGRGRDS